MSTQRLLLFAAAVALSACAERPILDTAHPAIDGQVGSVSHRDIAHVIQLARQHLVESGRGSHVIYEVEIDRSDMISIHQGEPPKHSGDCLEQFFYDRVKGHWQLRQIETICGENLPTG